MIYNYKSIKEIDKETLDYLDFVAPEPLDNMKINEINDFLTKLDMLFSELDNASAFDYMGEREMEI